MKQKINSYRELIVWKKSHHLAKEIIKLARNFSQTDEAHIIKRQLLRSSTSIPANIAEGFGGIGGNYYKNALVIAKREATETDYWLLLSYELGIIEEEIYIELSKGYDEIRAMLSTIIEKLKKDY